MVDPIFWLGLSILLVAVSLTAVLVTLLPAVRELSRAARSAEKLFDTLNRELPPTLESIRLTGMEITNLKEDVSEGVQSASRVVGQVDQSITGVKQQAQRATQVTRRLFVGVKAAWKTFTQPQVAPSPGVEQLPPSTSSSLDLEMGIETDLRDLDVDRADYCDEQLDRSNDQNTYQDDYQDDYLEEVTESPRPLAPGDALPTDLPQPSQARIYNPDVSQAEVWGDRDDRDDEELNNQEPTAQGRKPRPARETFPFDESILDQPLTEPQPEPTTPRNKRRRTS